MELTTTRRDLRLEFVLPDGTDPILEDSRLASIRPTVADVRVRNGVVTDVEVTGPYLTSAPAALSAEDQTYGERTGSAYFSRRDLETPDVLPPVVIAVRDAALAAYAATGLAEQQQREAFQRGYAEGQHDAENARREALGYISLEQEHEREAQREREHQAALLRAEADRLDGKAAGVRRTVADALAAGLDAFGGVIDTLATGKYQGLRLGDVQNDVAGRPRTSDYDPDFADRLEHGAYDQRPGVADDNR